MSDDIRDLPLLFSQDRIGSWNRYRISRFLTRVPLEYTVLWCKETKTIVIWDQTNQVHVAAKPKDIERGLEAALNNLREYVKWQDSPPTAGQ